jgi:RNA polymerase sigma-70 factor (ECF subfamily)
MASFQRPATATVCDHDSILSELPYLRRFARALTANATNADDLVHDCVVKALENSEKFEPGTNLRAWLFTILRNGFISDIRRNRRRLTETDSPRWATGGVAPPSQEGSLTLRRLEVAMGRLPIEQRTVLALVVIEGMNYEHAAEALGVPVGTVRSRLSRARHALRETVEGRGEGAARRRLSAELGALNDAA